jgi:hypothetical protein
MKISPEIFFAISIVGTLLILALLAVDDRIIRYVCSRENRKYSIRWIFSPYWLWRVFKMSWFAEAQRAGFLAARVTLLAAWFCYIAACVYVMRDGNLT